MLKLEDFKKIELSVAKVKIVIGGDKVLRSIHNGRIVLEHWSDAGDLIKTTDIFGRPIDGCP